MKNQNMTITKPKVKKSKPASMKITKPKKGSGMPSNPKKQGKKLY